MKRIFNLQNLFKVFLYSIAIICLVIARPLVVNADSISSTNIIGVEPRILDYNVSVNPQSQTINGTTYSAVDYVIEFIVKLDSYYYGEITGDLSFYWDTYTLSNNTATPVRNHTEINDKIYFVNGNSFIISYELRAIKTVNTSHEDLFDPYYQIIFSVDSSDVVNYDILEHYNQWDIPIESLNVNLFALQNGLEVVDVIDYNYMQFPIFAPKYNEYFYTTFIYKSQGDYVYIFMDNSQSSNLNTLKTNYSFWVSGGNTIDVTYSYKTIGSYNNRYLYLYFVNIHTENDCSLQIRCKVNRSDFIYIPIYFRETSYNLISTDFALSFGLSNRLLDDLNIIAQGTQQSSSSSSILDSNTSQLNSDSQQMFSFENTQNTNMNNALQNINTNLDIGTFGSKFLASASWVKTQFDNITNSSPFGSVLSFSLILGLAMLIIGKVRK